MNRLGAVLVALAAACARIAPPPGGPVETTPPVLLATMPDSLRSLPGFRDFVEFEFDRVVSEGQQPNFGQGTGTLEQLVLVSPSDQVPVVRWRRSRIVVRPREGWRPNTTYRIELLAGIRDLRNNLTRTSTVVTFTTGETLPGDTLVGRVVDWGARRPAPNALVLAVLMPDSLVYRTTADSSGRFRFGPLPGGEYLVFGVIDQNRNRRLDPREAFDTVWVPAGRDSVGEIWAFQHDTLPPRIQTVARLDSVSVAITFNMMLDPGWQPPVDSVTLLRIPDSVAVPVETLLPQAIHDSVYRARPPVDTAAADTAAVPDTLPAPPPPPPPPAPGRQIVAARPGAGGAPQPPDTTDRGPLTGRPALFDRLVLRSADLLVPGGRYVVVITGIRSVSGVAGSVQGALLVPAAPAPPVPGLPRDTAAAPVDTGRAVRDTARR